jgi:hypothetical protein
VLLHVASQGSDHIALVIALVAAGALAGFFAVAGESDQATSEGTRTAGVSRGDAVAIVAGLAAAFIFIALVVI